MIGAERHLGSLAVEPAETVVVWNDLAAAARYRAVHSRVWWGLVPVCALLAAGAVAAPLPLLSVMGIFLVIYIGTCPFWGPTMATWMQARRRDWPDSPTTWVPAADGLSISSSAGQSTLPWTSLNRVIAWRRGVTMAGERAVVFVPERAFSGEEHRRSFVAASQEHIAAGGG
jgi:hypothetical protein